MHMYVRSPAPQNALDISKFKFPTVFLIALFRFYQISVVGPLRTFFKIPALTHTHHTATSKKNKKSRNLLLGTHTHFY